MNPGPVEEAGQTARGLVEALKSQPLILALVVFNLVFVIVVYFGLRDARNTFFETIRHLVEQQQKNAEMLYNCVPVDKQNR